MVSALKRTEGIQGLNSAEFYTPHLRKFNIPTLIIHGDDDQMGPIGASALASAHHGGPLTLEDVVEFFNLTQRSFYKNQRQEMKKEVGLWIDQAKAVIFSLADEGAALKRVALQKNVTGENSDDPNIFYNEVLASIRDAESILIFGPGEAKVELKHRLELLDLQGRIVGFETADTMTDNQIVSKVRHRFVK